jgi:hypothetical protein
MTEHHEASGSDESDKLRGWFTGRIPEAWFEGPPSVVTDREEITVIGSLPVPSVGKGASAAERAEAIRGRVRSFRESSRDERVAIAREIEHRTDRTVSWGVEIDDERVLFTHLAAPVMTRLRQPERQTLDTLVAAGVARSRADALAWCVRLVGQHTNDWLVQLREAMTEVERVRAAGPAE